jgi:hypothetical protein
MLPLPRMQNEMNFNNLVVIVIEGTSGTAISLHVRFFFRQSKQFRSADKQLIKYYNFIYKLYYLHIRKTTVKYK